MPRDKGEESLASPRKSLGVLGFIGFEQPNLSIHLAMTCGRRHAVVLVVLQYIFSAPKAESRAASLTFTHSRTLPTCVLRIHGPCPGAQSRSSLAAPTKPPSNDPDTKIR